MPFSRHLKQPSIDHYDDGDVSVTHCHAKYFIFRYSPDHPKAMQQDAVNSFFKSCQADIRQCSRLFREKIKTAKNDEEIHAIKQALRVDQKLLDDMDAHISSSCTIS